MATYASRSTKIANLLNAVDSLISINERARIIELDLKKAALSSVTIATEVQAILDEGTNMISSTIKLGSNGYLDQISFNYTAD